MPSQTPTPTGTPSPETPEPAKLEPSLLDPPADPDAPAGAPEKYEDFTLPEGFEMPAELRTEAETLLKELNLPQDKAQKAVDFFTAKMKASADASATAFADLKAGWRKDAVADTSIGTGTQIKPEVLQSVGRAIDNLGPELSKGFREAMNLTGVGDNPAFIKAFYAMASKVTEGRPTAAHSPAPVAAPGAGRTSLAAAIYPNLPE